MITGDYIEVFSYYKQGERLFAVTQEIIKVNRIYKTDRDNDNVILDIYDMILDILDVQSLEEKSQFI